MRRIALLLPLLGLFTAFEACKKSDRQPVSPIIAVSEYLKLTPGNYWVYESYLVDSNGNGGPGSENGGAPYYDSVYVAADTVFGGHTWHTLMQPVSGTPAYYSTRHLRDSLNYEVDEYGRIILAPDDFDHTLYTRTQSQSAAYPDSALLINTRMGDRYKVVYVPAGRFTTIAHIISYTFYPFAGTTASPQRRQYERYAPGIGLISQTQSFYYADPMYVENRLLRYHVQ